ncbi:hypothetical protein B0H13DRAFT_2384571 [Mycena leptocephala]|nr:hypothetical protein B0H13DRAFT_2384571 [Mycena leptocephala]
MRPRPPFACARMLPSAPAAPRLPDRRRGDQRCQVALTRTTLNLNAASAIRPLASKSNFCRGLRIAAISRPAPLLVDAEHHPPGLPASIPLLQTLNMNIFTYSDVPLESKRLGPRHMASMARPGPSPFCDGSLPAARTFPRIKKQEHIVLCHPQHENTTPEAPHNHTPHQTGNLVSSLIHTIHTRQHTHPPSTCTRTRSMPRTRSLSLGSAPSPPRSPPPSPQLEPAQPAPFPLPIPHAAATISSESPPCCTTSALDRISSTTRSAFAAASPQSHAAHTS